MKYLAAILYALVDIFMLFLAVGIYGAIYSLVIGVATIAALYAPLQLRFKLPLIAALGVAYCIYLPFLLPGPLTWGQIVDYVGRGDLVVARAFIFTVITAFLACMREFWRRVRRDREAKTAG